MKINVRNSAVVLFAIGANLLAIESVAAQDTYRLEQNGVIVFDAESEPADGDWQAGTEHPDSLGDGYYQWEGDNGGPGRGTMRYYFTVQTPGNYQIRLRSRIGKGQDNTEHNDSWIRVPTGIDIPDEEPLGNWIKFYQNVIPAAWTWDTRTVDFDSRDIRQCFAAGDHFIELSGRSNSHAVDRIALYRYDDVAYSESAFDALPLSPTSVVASGIDPSESTACDFEIIEEPEIEPLDPIAETDPEIEQDAGQCLIDTVQVKAANDSVDINGVPTSAELLEVAYLERRALLKFDISLVPAGTEAYFNFTTANTAGEGQLDIYLGSHSNWGDIATSNETDQTSDETNQISTPDSAALLGTVTGSWKANTRHQIALDASLLQGETITLVLEMPQAADELAIVSTETAEAAAALVITGDDQFCATYDENVLTASTPVVTDPEIPPEEEEPTNPQPVEPPVTEEPVVVVPDPEKSGDDVKKSSGGTSSLLLLSLLCTLLLYRRAKIVTAHGD